MSEHGQAPADGGAVDVRNEVHRWMDAFRSPGIEAIHRMATEYVSMRDELARARRERDEARAEVGRLRNCHCYVVPGPGETQILMQCDSCKALARAAAQEEPR